MPGLDADSAYACTLCVSVWFIEDAKVTAQQPCAMRSRHKCISAAHDARHMREVSDGEDEDEDERGRESV